MPRKPKPFWERKSLTDMTKTEWESLCDGCGRCCLIKLEDEETAEIYTTRLSCRLLDPETCTCTDYKNRHKKVADCLSINAETLDELSWLPSTCAYRRIANGQGLEWWHPLVSGRSDSVHEAGVSVREFAVNETKTRPPYYYRYIISDYEA